MSLPLDPLAGGTVFKPPEELPELLPEEEELSELLERLELLSEAVSYTHLTLPTN